MSSYMWARPHLCGVFVHSTAAATAATTHTKRETVNRDLLLAVLWKLESFLQVARLVPSSFLSLSQLLSPSPSPSHLSVLPKKCGRTRRVFAVVWCLRPNADWDVSLFVRKVCGSEAVSRCDQKSGSVPCVELLSSEKFQRDSCKVLILYPLRNREQLFHDGS